MPELVTEFPETAAQSSARSLIGGNTAAMMRENLAERRRVHETVLPAASEAVSRARRESGELSAASATELGSLAQTQAKERAASRPAEITPPAAPSPSRAFLDPPASVLGQIQNLIFGIGQIAQGFAGSRGSAIGGLTALKGALEGWQAGDAERVQSSLAQWRTHWEVIKQKHRDAIEAHRDLLADHRSTMDVALMRHKLLADQQDQKLLSAVAEKRDVFASLAALDQERRFLNQLMQYDESLERYRQTAAATEKRHVESQKLAALSPEVKHHLAEVMHVNPLTATDAQLTEARRAADKKKLEDEERKRRERREDRAGDRSLVLEQRYMRGGPWADRRTGQIVDNITRGEWDEAGGHSNFKPVTKQQQQSIDILEAEAMPQIDQLKELGSRILARYPGQNLATLVANYTAGKLSDSDVREYQQARNAVGMTLSRALGGSSAIRQFIFKALEAAEVPAIGDTQKTMNRMAENSRVAIVNFIRSAKGWRPFPLPASTRTVEGVNDAGETAQIRLSPYEPLPPGWRYRY